jgi:hypothetical protein
LVGKPLGKRPFRRLDNFKLISKKWNGRASTGFIWLRRGSCEHGAIGFHKVLGISLLAEQLIASEAPYSME